MNDYSQRCTLRFLYGIIDIMITNPPIGSEFDFPYHLASDDCPGEVFINMIRNQKISFDYRYDQGHIISNAMLEILSEMKLAKTYCKSISFNYKGGRKTTKDYSLLFFPHIKLVDYASSSFYDVVEGESAIAKEISFIEDTVKYDVFELESSMRLGGMLVINEKVVMKLRNNDFTGFKIIPINEALEHYCKDFFFDIHRVLKKNKIKLP